MGNTRLNFLAKQSRWKHRTGYGEGVIRNVTEVSRGGGDAHEGSWNLMLLSKHDGNSKRLKKERVGLLLNKHKYG